MNINFQPFNDFKKIQSNLKKSSSISTQKPETTKKETQPAEKSDIAEKGLIGGAVAIAAGLAGRHFIKSAFNHVYKNYHKLPENVKYLDEFKQVTKRISEKINNNQHFDIAYYKDQFRKITLGSETLRDMKKTNPKKLDILFSREKGRRLFLLQDGYLIHGKNTAEKKKLFDHFISEAKKADIDVVHIPAGDTDGIKFSQTIMKLFPEAKEKFIKEKKQTMFVIEDVDKVLRHGKGREGGLGRASINEHTQGCGSDGVTWLSTAKDIKELDSSCVRGGRVTFRINIDEALELSKKGMPKAK